MTENTSLGFDNGVLVDEGAGILLVAFDTDGIILRRGFRHALLECAVYIVTICAVHEALVHLVVERTREGRFHVFVAGVAERGLRKPQKVRLVLRFVDSMTVGATDACFCMCGAIESFMIALMTLQAAGVDFEGGALCKAEDLGGVAAGVDVCLSRTVATFTSDTFAPMFEFESRMRIASEAESFSAVAHGACACPGEVLRLR